MLNLLHYCIYIAIEKVAFYFVQSTPSKDPKDGLQFHEIFQSENISFDRTLFSKFVSKQDGVYWLLLNIVSKETSHLNVTLQGVNQWPTPQLLRVRNASNKIDILSSSIVQNLTAGQRLALSSSHSTYADNSHSAGSSWGGFKLDQLMSPLIVFEVSNYAQRFHGHFEIVRSNIGNGWSPEQNGFIAPIKGLYYFSATLLVQYGQNTSAHFTVNNKTFCTFYFAAKQSYIQDMNSRGCFLPVNAGDVIKLILSGYSNKPCNCSFRGFCYVPVHNKTIAWSVHRNFNAPDGTNDKLNFNKIIVNKDKIWHKHIQNNNNDHYNQLKIPVSGMYFIELVSTATNIGSIDMQLNILKNVTLLRLNFASRDGYVTRNRLAVIHLNKADILSISCSSSPMFSNYSDSISFQGFLLYPDIL